MSILDKTMTNKLCSLVGKREQQRKDFSLFQPRENNSTTVVKPEKYNTKTENSRDRVE